MTHEHIGPRVEPDVWRQITVTIEGRPPSLNARRHWRRVAKDNAEWKATAHFTALEAMGRWRQHHAANWRALMTCELDVTFLVPTMGRHDWDNLVSTLKPLLDGIVQAEIIPDDDSVCIEVIRLSIVYEKGREATVLTFSEAMA